MPPTNERLAKFKEKLLASHHNHIKRRVIMRKKPTKVIATSNGRRTTKLTITVAKKNMTFIKNIPNMQSDDNKLETYDASSIQPKRINVVDKEIKMIKKNNTWELIDLPQNKEVIGIKWVYKN